MGRLRGRGDGGRLSPRSPNQTGTEPAAHAERSARPVRVPAGPLHSDRLGLGGLSDHLLRVGEAYVLVEQKPSARRLQQSHILQVGALCLLVLDVYGVRSPYGIVVLADGSQERVTFSEELERGVVRMMAELRRILATGEPAGPRWVGAKCRACGYQPVCWDDQGHRVVDQSGRAGA